MNIGLALASVKSQIAVALITLIPDGSVRLAVAVDAASVPASALLETVVRAPEPGVRVTWTTVPIGIFAASRAMLTGLACAAGTKTSGTPFAGEAGNVGEELFALWKDADADLPALIEAKKGV